MSISIQKKIGQLIMMDFRYWGGDSNGHPIPFKIPNKIILELFSKYNLGSFILFKENLEDNKQILTILRALQEASSTPLLFGIDQEGGRVNRLQQGTSTCGNMAIGATGDPENARVLSKLIGDELYALGFNLNFAPVADINSNPKNPIIGVRAYSDNPSDVLKMVKSSIQGYKQANIIPCIKHFPGHGNTELDTHLGIVTIDSNRERLDNIELSPYSHLCNNDYDAVMTAHISVPALDDTKFRSLGGEVCMPASLSYKITTELLKEKLNFKGLVITDAMDMKAISASLNPVEALKRTILAGTDIAMMPVRVWSEDCIYKLDELFVELEKEYLNNSVFAKRIDESYNKIMKFKSDKKLDESPLFTMTYEEQLQNANKIVNSQKHKYIELDIAKKAITITRKTKMLPVKLKDSLNLLIVDSDNARLNSFSTITQSIASEYNCRLNIVTRDILYDLRNDILQSDLVIIVSESLKKYSIEYSKINQLAKVKSINIAALTPYDINYMDSVENYVCIYGATSMDQTNYTKTILEVNIEAGLMSIFATPTGKIINAANGTLPVNLDQI